MKKSLLVVIVILAGAFAQAQSNIHMRKGDRLYQEKKYEEALPEFRQAAEEMPEDPVASFNLADTYFRTGKFEEAAKACDKALDDAQETTVRQKAFYNKGVSLSRQHKLEESIAAYKSALLLDPSDSDARINLQKALLERKKNQDPEKEKKEEQKNNKQQKQNNPPPQSKLNKKQVEQLLKALDQREQQVQQKMMQNRARGVNKPDKDW